MSDQKLSIETATEIAESLCDIPGARSLTGALKARALELIDWCRGHVDEDGREWTPEEQARWLETEARSNWDEFGGPSQLKRMFFVKFPKPEKQFGCNNCDNGWIRVEGRRGSGLMPCPHCRPKPEYGPQAANANKSDKGVLQGVLKW
jgi:hypothetical protein